MPCARRTSRPSPWPRRSNNSSNDRLIQYLAAEKIEITNNAALGIKRNVEIRRLPIPVEYNVARKTYLAAATKPDGIYIPCGGWGSIHNIELLEKDLDTTVVT